MRKIAVINYKGGTGKTSTVVNLAHGLALKGHKVLVVDTDPQGSAGHYLGLNPEKTLYDLLILGLDFRKCTYKARYNLDIICSNERVYPAVLEISKKARREFYLKKSLDNVSGYDFVIVDCAPSMNLMNQNALLYADEVIVPVSMEYLSLVGVKQLLKNIKIINRIFNKEIKITRVIPTFYDKRNKKSKDILDSINRVFPSLVSVPVRVNIRLSEAPGKRMSIFEYDPNSIAAEEYYNIIEELVVHG